MRKNKSAMYVGTTLSSNDRGEGWVHYQPTNKGGKEGGKEAGKEREKERYYSVAGSYPGDVIEFEVGASNRKRRKNLGFLKKIISSKLQRTTPVCRHFNLCGGCDRQDLSYQNQLKMKQTLVDELMEPLINNENSKELRRDIIPSQNTTNYRNRMDYFFGSHKWLDNTNSSGIGEKIDMRGCGLHVKGLHDRVIHIEECHLHPSNHLRDFIHRWAMEEKIPYYNSRSKTGWLKGLTVRSTLSEEYMLTFEVIEENDLLDTLKAFVEAKLLPEFKEIKSVYLVINHQKQENITQLEHRLLFGEAAIVEKCGPVHFNIYPQTFYQTNSDQALKLYNLVKELVASALEEIKQTIVAANDSIKILDLYCGIGSIGIFLAHHFHDIKVLGVEMVEAAVKAAQENAATNQVENLEFICSTVEDLEARVEVSLIILDPPRAGLHPKVIDFLKKSKATQIIYVSCNPFTLRRDLEELNHVYHPVFYQPVDMFPQTHHIETVVRLVRHN